jgi:hypothetical protein
MSAKSLSGGTNGAEPEKTYLDLLTSYASALTDLSLACNRLHAAIFQLALPRSQKVRWSVVCGRPVSGLSCKGGAKLKVVGK